MDSYIFLLVNPGGINGILAKYFLDEKGRKYLIQILENNNKDNQYTYFIKAMKYHLDLSRKSSYQIFGATF